MINFTEKQPNNRRYIQQVTSWVEDALPESIPDDVLVMVNELQCFEPVWPRRSPTCQSTWP